MDIIKGAFNDIESTPLSEPSGLYGMDYLDRIAGLQIGQGSKVMRADQSGLWLGGNTFADAPFSVDMLGNIIATSATISGYKKNFTSTIAWTATDTDTASWGAGTLYFSDGTSYSIASGNTGNIAATTYIYLDTEVSSTVLQATTTASSASGNTKTLIAIVSLVSGANVAIDVQSGVGTVIAGSKISTGSLAAISALLGTVDVGGSGNGNGVLRVKDASGVEKVTLDSSGITIIDGKLTIKDSAATTIIDSGGIISTASFNNSTATKSLDQTITGTSFADVTSLTITFTASLTRAVNVLFLTTITGYHNDIDGMLIFKFQLDGNDVGPQFALGRIADVGVSQTSSAQFIYQVSSGSHTIKIQGRGNNASPSNGVVESSVLAATLSYVALGK